MLDAIKQWINPEKKADLLSIKDYQNEHLPTLWLLGKTGAGKSSLIQALTGLTNVEVGDGFSPCTQSSLAYDFPQDQPLLRFLDTRGLGEAHYDPTEDIELCAKQGHVLLIVAKIEEQEQSAILTTLKLIRKKKQFEHVLVIHTAINAYPMDDKNRLQAHNQAQFEKAWGDSISAVEVDFDCDAESYHNRDKLIEVLSQMLPIIGLTLRSNEYQSMEEKNFSQCQKEVLWYAGAASASDLIPAVGLVSVPAIQAKMLHSLANQYGIDWNRRTFSELIATLGASFSVQYGVKLGARQLVKLIPVYGQTIGAASAAAISFGTTYGLGRVACYYFHHKGNNEPINEAEIQALYKKTFDIGKKVAGNAKD